MYVVLVLSEAVIDENTASQARVDEPFYLKTAGFNDAQNRMELTFGPGKASFLGNLVSFSRDTTVYLDNPLLGTAYFVYIKSDGTIMFNITGGDIPGAVVIWKVLMSQTRQISLEDLRGQLPGAGARVVQDNLTAHINAPDPHPVYATDNDLATHQHDTVYVKLSANNMVPPGVVNPFAGLVAPPGWLLCYGQVVSRSTYSDLFNVIGTTYGTGDGSSTFNVPDLRGCFPLGKDNMGGNPANRVVAVPANQLGHRAGEEKHTLTIAELARHNHSATYGSNGSGSYFGSGAGGYMCVTMDTTGGDQPHNNMPPYLTLNYIIKY